jgi:hypothetical protein
MHGVIRLLSMFLRCLIEDKNKFAVAFVTASGSL